MSSHYHTQFILLYLYYVLYTCLTQHILLNLDLIFLPTYIPPIQLGSGYSIHTHTFYRPTYLLSSRVPGTQSIPYLSTDLHTSYSVGFRVLNLYLIFLPTYIPPIQSGSGYSIYTLSLYRPTYLLYSWVPGTQSILILSTDYIPPIQSGSGYSIHTHTFYLPHFILSGWVPGTTLSPSHPLIVLSTYPMASHSILLICSAVLYAFILSDRVSRIRSNKYRPKIIQKTSTLITIEI